MMVRLLACAAAALLLGACTMGDPYQRPAVDLPARYEGAPAKGTPPPAERWWTVYRDPALDRLVDESLANNQDIAVAAARVDEARAVLRVVDSQTMPAVDAGFAGDRSRRSEVTATPYPPGTALESSNYRAQLSVSYEVDLWGRLRSATDAARANLLATEAARETVRLSVATETVRAYFLLVSLDAQVTATSQALALRSRGLALQQVRAAAGLISDFSLRQLEGEVYAAQSQLPALEAQRTAVEGALAVLAGRSPRAITEGTVARRSEQGEPQSPVVPAGLPSDLLLRRPDIVEAEQRLIAANARIAEARAALFPRIALTGILGSESAALGSLFSGPAAIWTIGFALAQPIFQGGRLFAEIELVKARERAALAQYQKALQESFREVRQALSTQQRAREVFDAESARTVALSDALKLAVIRYQNGLLSQLDVIDAERNLLQAELNRADALRFQRAAIADLVKALGGGWQGLDAAAPVAQAPRDTTQ